MKPTIHLLMLCCICGLSLIFSCQANLERDIPTKPNVILIMADDMGYECLSSNGSTAYHTPNIDQLGKAGMRFTKCISQPLCTPSRVKIMTGMYNYRNYEHFTYLNPNQKTFGHLMKDAGYETCIVGKWQLNGLVYELPGYDDPNRPFDAGFDEYCLWQLTKHRREGERFAYPLLEQNGEVLPRDSSDYGPDIVSNFALDFMERNQEKPFFVYYPMILVHNPFVPTPDSEEWADPVSRFKADTSFFTDMMAYTDKIVGRFVTKLEELNIRENTILIFTADNGTNRNIFSNTSQGIVRGGKGNTIDHGTHVPLVISWPAKMAKGTVYNELVEFSDFFATLAELTQQDSFIQDGHSFYKLLAGEETFQGRETAFVHYDPKWSKSVNQFRNQFARTLRYKLYQDGRFLDLDRDVLEKMPIPDSLLSAEQKRIKSKLQAALDEAPPLPAEEATAQ